jgi:hypothetical protein
MLEILSKIADLLLSGSERIRTIRDNAKRREFGKNLLNCYLRVLEVVTTGQEIVKELEYYVERSGRYQASGKEFRHSTYSIRALFKKQSINLHRLSGAIIRIYSEISVLNPDVGFELKNLIWEKRNIISRLGDLLGSGCYYAGPELKAPPGQYGSLYVSRLEQMDSHILHLNDEWKHEKFQQINKYLREREPRKQLEKLQVCAMQIRKLIVKYLTIEEILWSVEDFDDTDI